jgi:hypothetical protein
MSELSETNIYEHGIAEEGGKRSTSLRVLATTSLPIYSGFTLTIVDDAGNSLNERAAHLANVNGPYTSADYYEENDLRYCVLATLYHLNRLIELYVQTTTLFERIHPRGTAIEGNTWNANIFYEVDAFLGAARPSLRVASKDSMEALSGRTKRSLEFNSEGTDVDWQCAAVVHDQAELELANSRRQIDRV